MEQRMSCRSETDSVLTARQRSCNCQRRRSYSSCIRCRSSRSGCHGQRSRGQEKPPPPASRPRWSLIHDSTRLWMDAAISPGGGRQLWRREEKARKGGIFGRQAYTPASWVRRRRRLQIWGFLHSLCAPPLCPPLVRLGLCFVVSYNQWTPNDRVRLCVCESVTKFNFFFIKKHLNG